MKNKKIFVGITLLIVVLLLGIGYAAITDSLEIKGTATTEINQENFKVVFTGETNPATATDGVTATAAANSKSATLNVTGLSTKGDSKSATFTIENQSEELKALVDVKTKTIENEEFFSVDAVVANAGTALNPGDTTTVTVTVTLDKTPIDVLSGNIDIDLEATAVLGN